MTQNKIVTVFGLPSVFSKFGAHVVRVVVNVCMGPSDDLSSNTVEELAGKWPERKFSNAFLFTDYPDKKIIDIYIRSSAPIFVFLEDFDDVIDFLEPELKIDYVAAGQLALHSLMAVYPVMRALGALVVRRGRHAQVRDLLQAVFQHLDLTSTPELWQRVLNDLGLPDDEQPLEHAVTNFIRVEKMEAARAVEDKGSREWHLKQLLRWYQSAVHEEVINRLAWPTALLRPVDPSIGSGDSRLRLIGPARLMTYGPYLNVPEGQWRATLTFSVWDNFSGNHFAVDVIAHNNIIAEVETTLPASGRFSLQIDFTIDDNKGVVEIRTMIREGAIEGEIEFEALVIERIKPKL